MGMSTNYPLGMFATPKDAIRSVRASFKKRFGMTLGTWVMKVDGFAILRAVYSLDLKDWLLTMQGPVPLAVRKAKKQLRADVRPTYRDSRDCPECGSTNIETLNTVDDWHTDRSIAIECLDCEAEWDVDQRTYLHDRGFGA